MKDKLSLALEDCLQRLRAGSNLEECLARYPEQAAELEPLLRTALALRRQATAVPVPPHLHQQGRDRVLAALAARSARRQRRPTLGWGWRWAVASLVLATLVGWQAVHVSAQSLPGETLYPAKRAAEQVQMAVTTSPTARAELNARLASRRLHELLQIAQKGRMERDPQRFERAAEALLEDHAHRLEGMAAIAVARLKGSERENLGGQVQTAFEAHQARLWQLLEQAPEPARPALRRAIRRSRRSYQQVLKAVFAPGARAAQARGRLLAVHPQTGRIVLLHKRQGSLVLRVSPDTLILRDGQPVPLEALAPGDRVTATYDRTDLEALRLKARSTPRRGGDSPR